MTKYEKNLYFEQEYATITIEEDRKMNNNERSNTKGIFYGIIGVATLIISIIGATFAYFMASQINNNVITGNAATVSFGMAVTKVTTVDEANGMIPMTNGMIYQAIQGGQGGDNSVCVDDNGNAVCQIYKITINNTGSADLFLDGYVNLTGGAPNGASQDPTNMRWVQLFASTTNATEADGAVYSTTGVPALATGATGISQISLTADGNTNLNGTQATSTYVLNGNSYDYISNNYMRISGNTSTFSRTNTTSALVYNQVVASGATLYLYFVVWLSETGTDQTIGSGANLSFFSGTV